MSQPYLTSFCRWIFNQAFPEYCLWCGMATVLSGEILCLLCSKELPIASHSCQQCGYDLSIAHAEKTLTRCGTCLVHPKNNFFIHAFKYQTPINEFIYKLKFKGDILYSRLLARFLLEKIMERYRDHALPSLLLPVPLHPNRLRERGFNQAIEIARPIAKALHIPLQLTWLTRHKYTEAQSGLNRKERQDNVKHAFIADAQLRHQHVAVIDDVSTTGATHREVERALNRVDCHHIDFWCAAKTE